MHPDRPRGWLLFVEPGVTPGHSGEGSAWPFVEMTQQTLDRAVAVQDALAERSQQRGAKIADLLIAAAAEAAGLVLLHYGHDFDLITEITGHPTERILPAGTVS